MASPRTLVPKNYFVAFWCRTTPPVRTALFLFRDKLSLIALGNMTSFDKLVLMTFYDIFVREANIICFIQVSCHKDGRLGR